LYTTKSGAGSSKGGIFSKSFSLGLKSPKKSILFLGDSAQDSDLAHVIGDLSQSEKHSDIKPPLLGDRFM